MAFPNQYLEKNAVCCKKYIKTDKICSALQISSKSFVYLQCTAFLLFLKLYKEYYQVSLSVRDENTMKRELAPLQAVSDYYPKYLLTLDNDPEVLHDGIRQLYVLDWLVN